MRSIKVGLCGFTMSSREYPTWFPVVEVQQTFYEPPGEATLRRWRASMPAGFEFTMKAWQLVTHTATSSTYRRLRRPLSTVEREGLGSFKPTAIVAQGWATSLACARLLGATAILFQCPASFRPTDEHVANLRGFFARIERPEGVRLLWEPRGRWPDDLVRDLCRELGLVHVVDPFERPALTTRPTYYRLHGVTGSRHVYTDAELARLGEMIPAEGETYVLFNNIPRVGDAQRFLRRLTGAPVRAARTGAE